MLAGVAVWRLTESPLATAAAPALSMLTPWALREHGALTPELLAPAVLLGAALLASRERWAAAAGALAATAPFLKWPYALALIAIVVFSAAPRRAALWALGALALQALVFTALFGFGLWDDSVIAQMSSGRRGIGILKGVWGQAFWSLIGLVVLAALALHRRAAVRDAPLLKVLAALAVAMLATLITNTKDGTGLNVLVPIEAALLPLALTGAVVTVRTAGIAARDRRRGRRARLHVRAVGGAARLAAADAVAVPVSHLRARRMGARRLGDRRPPRGRARRGLPAGRRPTAARRSWPSSRTARCPTPSRTSSCRRARSTSRTWRRA